MIRGCYWREHQKDIFIKNILHVVIHLWSSFTVTLFWLYMKDKLQILIYQQVNLFFVDSNS